MKSRNGKLVEQIDVVKKQYSSKLNIKSLIVQQIFNFKSKMTFNNQKLHLFAHGINYNRKFQYFQKQQNYQNKLPIPQLMQYQSESQNQKLFNHPNYKNRLTIPQRMQYQNKSKKQKLVNHQIQMADSFLNGNSKNESNTRNSKKAQNFSQILRAFNITQQQVHMGSKNKQKIKTKTANINSVENSMAHHIFQKFARYIIKQFSSQTLMKQAVQIGSSYQSIRQKFKQFLKSKKNYSFLTILKQITPEQQAQTVKGKQNLLIRELFSWFLQVRLQDVLLNEKQKVASFMDYMKFSKKYLGYLRECKVPGEQYNIMNEGESS